MKLNVTGVKRYFFSSSIIHTTTDSKNKKHELYYNQCFDNFIDLFIHRLLIPIEFIVSRFVIKRVLEVQVVYGGSFNGSLIITLRTG